MLGLDVMIWRIWDKLMWSLMKKPDMSKQFGTANLRMGRKLQPDFVIL